MTNKRPNTTATHYNHIDRVHSKRIIELATGICENAIDLDRMTYEKCEAEQRTLKDAIGITEHRLAVARREHRDDDVIAIGSQIQVINRRLGAVKLRLNQRKSERIYEVQRQETLSYKRAMREILPPDILQAVYSRANQIRDDSLIGVAQ